MTRLLALLLLSVTTHSQAQAIFDRDLSDASAKLTALMVRVERIGHGQGAERPQLQRELLDVAKSLHHIEEDASRADTELIAKDQPSDHQLVRTASIAACLSLADDLASYFLDTGDSAIWSAAVESMQTARRLQSAH